ncbi:MAG: major capsid protein [Arizlama microvirus]|nr:MAG: major capsid protein [Arizlama microvirus]
MKRSKHNLSYTKLFSCDMGELVPAGVTEILPGDTLRINTNALVRAAALLSPVMHPVNVRIHHWFVPTRLIWDNFEKFITGGPDGLDASVHPTITVPGGGFANGSLADYLGIPSGVGAGQSVSALPFRAYAFIFNEWYRDQDLVTAVGLSKADGVDATTNTTLQYCAWEKDYFTSARPWEQKGAAVTVPLGGQAPVSGIGFYGGNPASSNQAVRETSGATPTYSVWAPTNVSGTAVKGDVLSTGKPQVFAELAAATGVSVNALRASMAIQRFQEARARYGSRYPEYLASLGVRSSDARLSRPEYLGGGKQTIQFSEVVATAETGTSVDVGDLKGHGIAALRTNRCSYFSEEHGFLVTLLSVQPKTIYGNGLFRMWNRRTKLDYWQKELEHIGQQAIQNKEAYMAHSTPDGVFGYQDRYDEYRRSESHVSGEFRTSVLDFWHMARIFASNPSLNSTFVTCQPTERTFAVPANDVLYIHARHQILARRLVASRGTSYIF